MYSQKDYAKIEKKLLIRRLAVYIICGALLCAAIVAIVLSVQDWKGYLHKDSFGEEVVNRLFTHIKLYPLAFILPVIALCALIFGEGIFVSPVRHYRDYVRQALEGKTRSLECCFKFVETTPVLREGVWVLPVTASTGDIEKDKDDRLLYFDSLLPFPEWKKGEALQLTVHDRFIVNY